MSGYSGNPVIQDLVTSLAKTSVSNLSSYWNRKGVWSCLPRVAEKYFINSTVSGLLESAEDDHGCLVGLEPELVLAIEKRLSKGKLLRDNQTSVKVKLRLLDLFAVKEGVFIDFFRENTTEFSKSEAEALGNLISEKKWVESARNVKNKKYSYRNLEHAWKRCGHLVPHSWWETDRVKSETVISHTDSYKVDKTKILVLAASPTDQSQLNLSKEVREIEDQLEAAKYRDNFEVTSKVAAKFNTFTKAILDVSPQIVHFSGHGDVSGIVLEHDDGSTHFVDKEALNFIFHLLEDQVKCVLLNACYSEEQAKAISEHGIYVVGMSDSIEDAAAIAFSTGFYQSIGAGRDFQFSHEWGLAHIKGKASSNQKHVPVLWLNGKKIQTLT